MILEVSVYCSRSVLGIYAEYFWEALVAPALGNGNRRKLNLNLFYSQVIVHVDMDAFYAAVEEKDDPSLKTCPMAVGGMGMLTTSNYLARKFGVRAGMPGFIGKKLCPQLKIVPTNFSKYRAVSAQVREVFKEYDKNFCPMSLDEAYLNLTDYLLSHPSLTPGTVVNEMRAKIQEKTTLTASAGISLNCLVSKICSDLNKPNGQYELLDEDEMRKFVAQLPIRKVGGIGNVTEQMLDVFGVKTCQVPKSKTR